MTDDRAAHPPAASAPDPERPTNRLARESSPYLLLHAHNPVDWYPWGEEAFARARAEDKPIFVSVGYSTCYWCHVMERESFSHPEIAALMNQTFVNVKVDREERPDVDEIYMAATQILTGQGGWPNSVFLTPDLRPFYAGTYFPPADRYGRPGFGTLVAALADAWANRRQEVELQAEELAEVIQRSIEDRAAPRPTAPAGAELQAAIQQSRDLLARRFDPTWGGFGTAPKFPTVANLLLLDALASGRLGTRGMPASLGAADRDAGAMLTTTLDRMARGGFYDQLGGGFHRYATDREWRIPHFEKMLYDQGLLVEIYAREHARTGDPEAARVVLETAAFLAREMTAPEGFFWSAIDAETDGDEGAFYVWTRAELDAVLGPEDAAFAAPLLGFEGAPFFEHGRYVLHLPLSLAEQATKRRGTREELLAELVPLRLRLLAARDRRARPATDDKVLADWNGIAIAGLARAGRALGAPALVAQAARAADAVLAVLRPAGGGGLLHSWRAGRGEVRGMLADYAFLADGLLAVHAANAEPRFLAAAVDLADEAAGRLGDGEGGFFLAAPRADLLARSRDLFDGATPSSYGQMVHVLLELAERTGETEWLTRAERALAAVAGAVVGQPEATRTLLRAADRAAALAPATLAASAGAGAAGAPLRAPELEPRSLAPLLGRTGDEAPAAPADLVRAVIDLGSPGEDGWRRFALALRIEPGWHLYAASGPGSAETAALGLEVLRLEGVDGVVLRDLAYPDGTASQSDPPVAIYAERVSISGELRTLWPGRGRLLVRFQACDDHRCLPPAEVAVGLGH
jgi:uncharacterized protein YyaL (SSP411 family)